MKLFLSLLSSLMRFIYEMKVDLLLMVHHNIRCALQCAKCNILTFENIISFTKHFDIKMMKSLFCSIKILQTNTMCLPWVWMIADNPGQRCRHSHAEQSWTPEKCPPLPPSRYDLTVFRQRGLLHTDRSVTMYCPVKVEKTKIKANQANITKLYPNNNKCLDFVHSGRSLYRGSPLSLTDLPIFFFFFCVCNFAFFF